MNRKSAFVALTLAIAFGNVSVAMAGASKHTYAHHIYGWAADRAPANPRDAIAPGDAWVARTHIDPRHAHSHHAYVSAAARVPADPRDAH